MDEFLLVLLAAYASLALELSVIHVPSVASTANIWKPRLEHVEGFSRRYMRVLHFRRSTKFLAFVLPLIVIYALFTYPLVVAVIGPDPLGDYLYPPPMAAKTGAALLIVGGRVLALSAALSVRRLNSQKEGQFRLNTTGPFRWSRNPGLLGMYLFVLGMWLATPSVAMLIAIVVYIVHMDVRVRMEEDFLRGKFGDEFVRYSRVTPRYLL